MILRRVFVGVSLTVVIAGVILGFLVYPKYAYFRQFRWTQELILQLRSQRPPGILERHWEEAVQQTGFAHVNFWPEDEKLKGQLDTFSNALEQRIATGEGLETLRWVWGELDKVKVKSWQNNPGDYLCVRGLTPNPITDENVAKIWRIAHATTLDLSDTEVGNSGLEKLADLEQVRTLNLDRTGVTDDGLKWLSKMSQLTTLSMDGCQITGSGLGELSSLKNLEHVILNGTAISDENCGGLAQLPGLEVLELCRTKISGAGLSRFSRHEQLQILTLGETPLTDNDLFPLREFPRLFSLNLEKTKITDAAYPQLVALQKVSVLRLEGTRLRGEGILQLSRMPSLSNLTLPDLPEVALELQQLQSALPHCQIFVTTNPPAM